MTKMSKLNNLQVLRAFASISVVLAHMRFTLPGMHAFGTFGVDVFFVISGYIMARILHNNPDFFVRRRLLRIVPPYWFFTLLIFSLAWWRPQLLHSTGADSIELIKSLLFIPFRKQMPAGGMVTQPVLGAGWTLNMEMLFYLALAIGLFINRKHAAWIGSGVTLGIMFVSRYFEQHSSVAGFYARDVMLEFLIGILAFYFCTKISDQKAHQLRVAALVVCIGSGLLLIVLQGLIFQGPIDVLSLPRAVAFGIPAWFLITSACILSQAKWDINSSYIVLIGDASYILYLLHDFVVMAVDRVAAVRWPWLHVTTPLGALVAMSLSILAAVGLHVYVERPVLKGLLRTFGGKRPTTEFSRSASTDLHPKLSI